MNMRQATRLLAGGALGLAVSTAWAQGDPPPRPEGPPRAPIHEVFSEADANGDGRVTLEEIRAVRPGFPEEAFRRHDRNGDGVLTRDELPRGRGQGQGPRGDLDRGDRPRDGRGPGQGPREGRGPEAGPPRDGRGPGQGPREGRGPEGGPPRDGRGPAGPMMERLREADTNRDGKVTWEEFSAAFPNATRERFDLLDTDGDGALTPADRPPRGEGPGPEGRPRGPRPDGAPGERGPRPEGGWFSRLDTDGDGKVSRAEYMAGAPNASEARFNALDKDGDGYVTREEMRAAWEERRGDRPGPGRGPGRGPDGGAPPPPPPAEDDKGARAEPDWNAVREELITKHGTDGAVDFEAIAAAKPGFPRRTFERLDRNNDGVLSAADAAAGPGRGAMAREGRPDRPRRAAE